MSSTDKYHLSICLECESNLKRTLKNNMILLITSKDKIIIESIEKLLSHDIKTQKRCKARSKNF